MTMPATYIATQYEYNKFSDTKRQDVYTDMTTASVHTFLNIVRELPEIENLHILDLGCRTGGATVEIAAQLQCDRTIVGVDIVPEFTDAAIQLLEFNRPHLQPPLPTVVIADAHALPFADGTFHWTFCNQVLEHCYDLEQALSELRRVTTHGVYIGIPLEDTNNRDNPSHHTFLRNPIDWLDKFRSWDGWQLLTANPGPHPELGYFEFSLIHRSNYLGAS